MSRITSIHINPSGEHIATRDDGRQFVLTAAASRLVEAAKKTGPSTTIKPFPSPKQPGSPPPGAVQPGSTPPGGIPLPHKAGSVLVPVEEYERATCRSADPDAYPAEWLSAQERAVIAGAAPAGNLAQPTLRIYT